MNKYFNHIEKLLEGGCDYSDLVVQLMETFSLSRDKADDYLELYFEQNEMEENTSSSFRDDDNFYAEGIAIIEKEKYATINQDKVLKGVTNLLNEQKILDNGEKSNYSIDDTASFILQIPRARHLLNECIDGKKNSEDVISSITDYIIQNLD